MAGRLIATSGKLPQGVFFPPVHSLHLDIYTTTYLSIDSAVHETSIVQWFIH